MTAIKKNINIAIEEDVLAKRDEADPIFKALDDGVLTDQQIFSLLGWESIDKAFIASIVK
jgi:hypothetical protein